MTKASCTEQVGEQRGIIATYGRKWPTDLLIFSSFSTFLTLLPFHFYSKKTSSEPRLMSGWRHDLMRSGAAVPLFFWNLISFTARVGEVWRLVGFIQWVIL